MPVTDRKGFTLLEAVVGIAVVGFAATAALEALGAESRVTAVARRALREQALAGQRLAHAELLDAAELETLPDSVAGGTFPAPFAEYRWTTESRPVPGERGLYDVTVRIHGSQGTHAILTRLYRRGRDR